MSEDAGFFVVWNPERGNPRYRHPTLSLAEGEAERLALDSPGQCFYVLAALSFARVQRPVTVTKLNHDHDIPF